MHKIKRELTKRDDLQLDDKVDDALSAVSVPETQQEDE